MIGHMESFWSSTILATEESPIFWKTTMRSSDLSKPTDLPCSRAGLSPESSLNPPGLGFACHNLTEQNKNIRKGQRDFVQKKK